MSSDYFVSNPRFHQLELWFLTGMNFRAYLQKIRLGKAAELLASTRLPVGTIARRVGHRDFSRFGQHFKRMHGVEPRRWRALEVTKTGRQDVH
jgi:transcriptional regulator GlxA family with amidase domain